MWICTTASCQMPCNGILQHWNLDSFFQGRIPWNSATGLHPTHMKVCLWNQNHLLLSYNLPQENILKRLLSFTCRWILHCVVSHEQCSIKISIPVKEAFWSMYKLSPRKFRFGSYCYFPLKLLILGTSLTPPLPPPHPPGLTNGYGYLLKPHKCFCDVILLTTYQLQLFKSLLLWLLLIKSHIFKIEETPTRAETKDALDTLAFLSTIACFK